MKKSIFILAFSTYIAATMLTGCSSGKEDAKTAVEKAGENLEEAKADYQEEYNKFKIEANAQMETNEKRIDDLKAEAKEMNKDQKEAYEKKIESLERKNEIMKQKLKDSKDEGSSKWQDFKKEFNHDMDEFGQAFKDIGTNNVK